MAPMRQFQAGDLDLTISDPFERDIKYIYDEIFIGRAYDYPKLRVSERPTIIDIGANVGLFTIWAARNYTPRAIYSYEASPTTYQCLAANVHRHVSGGATAAHPFNLAMSDQPGRELVLNQPPWNSGLSTILDGSKLPWVDELRDKGELNTHKVQSTSVSHEIAAHGLEVVDLLKIDVEGYFMEVLAGIDHSDYARIRNIVLEAEYTQSLGHSAESLSGLLRDKGYTVEARDAAQVMIYAWRD